MLTAFIRPNHIDELCSWGLIHLSPHCSSNYFVYSLFLYFRDRDESITTTPPIHHCGGRHR
ncbi:hypothetical protein CIK83_13550 [Vibrio casei]|uniref:Uncharacterized protein n=1 Tax=Vibrio casei TaxID=673372 RepID=A0A368LIK6_9VIBR|nr:hypothetical protein CIK83_13550 [Vibrio casei]